MPRSERRGETSLRPTRRRLLSTLQARATATGTAPRHSAAAVDFCFFDWLLRAGGALKAAAAPRTSSAGPSLRAACAASPRASAAAAAEETSRDRRRSHLARHARTTRAGRAAPLRLPRPQRAW
eukprot:Amastigsp_a676920_24.p4 type:complete len:124 gc:universal Amastigsp_a676920_24:884-513(-)